jgi:hypothetical protein
LVKFLEKLKNLTKTAFMKSRAKKELEKQDLENPARKTLVKHFFIFLKFEWRFPPNEGNPKKIIF